MARALHLALVVGGVAFGSATPFHAYSSVAYNALLDYKVARSHALDTAAIADLGDIFMRHSVNDTFGLCLLHNHFKVNDGELMVEIVSRNVTKTSPRSLPDWAFAQDGNIVPSVMGLTIDGGLVPFEFLDLKGSDFGSFSASTRDILQSFFSHPEVFSAFLLDLASALESARLRHFFGVCVRHRDSVTSADPGGSSMETNHPRERWLRLDPMVIYANKFDVIASKFKRGEVRLGVLGCPGRMQGRLTRGLSRFQSTPTFWSFPLRCNAVGMGSGPTEGFCAECGCGGGEVGFCFTQDSCVLHLTRNHTHKSKVK